MDNHKTPHKHGAKLISLSLALAMLMSAVPVAAAEETQTTTSGTTITTGTTTSTDETVTTGTVTTEETATGTSEEVSVTASGKSGNTNWQLLSDGTLEFSAVDGTNGAMGNSSKWSTPAYCNYSDQIKTIVLKEGVTYIGSYDFAGCKVSCLSLPASLTSMDSYALTGATIASVTVAEGGTYSVGGNFLLKNGGTEMECVIDTSKFTGVVSIPEGVTTVKSGIFSNSNTNSGITGVIIPSSVTSIAARAFEGCPLESVTVPCNLTAGREFNECRSLKTVTIAEGVTTIADNSFCGCKNLTTVNLPKSLTTMTGMAWYYCPAISEINVAEGSIFSMKDNMLMKNGTEIVFALRGALSGEVTIPEGVTALGDAAFERCTGITSLKCPSTLKTIGKYAFYQCTGLTGITLNEGLTTLDSYAFQFCSNLAKVDLPTTLETLSDYAFNECSALKEIKIPDKVTSIGSYTFEGCSALEIVSLPANLTTISGNAFARCTALKTIDLPDKLTSLGMWALSDCESLESITVPCSVGDYEFYGCTALQTVTVKEGATSVGANAFSDCTALQSVSLPGSITSIGAGAFDGCTALTSVVIAEGSTLHCSDGLICSDTQVLTVLPYASGAITIASGITEISDSAFSGNTKITSVSLPDSVATIGASAFNNCTALTSVTLSSGLTSIGSKAFYGCSSLGMVTLPSGLQTIGANAFRDCTSMTGTLTLPASIVTYGNAIFRGCTGIEKVVFEDCADPDNANYGSQMFYNCTGIQSIQLPSNITKMNSMLYGCTSLTELTLPAGIATVSSTELNSSGTSLRYLEIKGATTVSSIGRVGSNLEQLVLPATLTSYNDAANYCHPTLICYRGTKDQWNQITFNENTLANFEKYGTIIVYEYDETTSIGETPVITKQPVGGSFEKGVRPDPLSIEVEEVEGATYLYTWYCDGKTYASGKECTISAATEGSAEYYCLVKCIKDNKISEIKSDVVTVTVTAPEIVFAGSGTAEDPYQITTAADLVRLSVYVEGGEGYEGKYFAMQNDITLPTGWVPIGCTKDGTRDIKRGANLNAFSGIFDGGNYTLSVPAGEKPLFAYVKGATVQHLKIYGTQINGYGLINNMEGVGLAGTAVIVDDVTLLSGTQTLKSGILGAELSTNIYAGCSAAYVSTIKNCKIEKDVIIGYKADQTKIGSFAGRMQGTIENCVSYATVKGTDYVGGINGTRDNAMGTCKISGCTFGGTVIASGKNAGGITGGGYSDSSAPNGAKVSIDGCTVTGTVTGDSNVGGILGGDVYVAQGWDNVAGTFRDNVFTGTVSGNSNVGAIIGFLDSINRVDDISGNAYSADCGATNPIGKVYLVDTNCENPTAYGDTIYVNTETSTSSCPYVTGCGWMTGYNRTDDPLGKDMGKLFEVLSEDGDVNMDGKIDASDVTMAYNYYLMKTSLKAAQINAADVDKNGVVDLDDILLLHDYVLGKVDSLTLAD